MSPRGSGGLFFQHRNHSTKERRMEPAITDTMIPAIVAAGIIFTFLGDNGSGAVVVGCVGVVVPDAAGLNVLLKWSEQSHNEKILVLTGR